MQLIHVNTGQKVNAWIRLLHKADRKKLSKNRFFFNWNALSTDMEVFGISIIGDTDIKGVIALQEHIAEKRIEITLLAVSRENVVLKHEKGKKTKEYEDIAGNLIAFAAREAIKRYGADACVSLVSKTELEQHYCKAYHMQKAGKSVALFGPAILKIVKDYLI